ncbi:acyltransferase [Prevotella sp. KH2C16]|uniref:acyltransferase n=1 Tax=Prevotella sp. KH2C16 TaxID=1855325 RepID=UPI0008E32816|nr:acyltransferase [Prevotella sp. KH2C16]SFG08785.1 Acetyltransferase (isoleucine patch superfamily) [Prevotella sp. KH2C16]
MAEEKQSNYKNNIQNRTYVHYLKGLLARWKQHFKYDRAVRIARKNGATIGEGVIMPISLAKKANDNLMIGNHVSIQTDKIDLRSPVTIGSNVIIGINSEIITTSHDIDSDYWEVKNYGIDIEDYVWIPTNVLILPSCRRIGYGAVIGSGSVVIKDVGKMSVVGGNPAVEFKKRATVHSNLIVESLLGGDYRIYKEAWKKRKK